MANRFYIGWTLNIVYAERIQMLEKKEYIIEQSYFDL